MALPVQAIAQLTNGYIQGNVDLAPGVAIAPGVILAAAPGCRLIISTGACLAADVVVQARNGDLLIGPGVSLGSGVLVIGYGSIGQHTCIAANSTVINPELGPSQVVSPGALVCNLPQATPESGSQQFPEAVPDPWADSAHGRIAAEGFSPIGSSYGVGPTLQSANVQSGPVQNGSASLNSPGQKDSLQEINIQNGSRVYGKEQVNRLLGTLFPHRQALNSATNGTPPENRP